jgi:hypothetical protein
MSTMFSCLGEETHAAVEIGGILQEEKRQQTRIAGIEGIFTQVFFSVYVFGTLFSIYEFSSRHTTLSGHIYISSYSIINSEQFLFVCIILISICSPLAFNFVTLTQIIAFKS